MIWFQWLLIGIFTGSILLSLYRLSGWEPEKPSNLITGIALLVYAFLIAGIVIWL